ncbi:MAG: secretin N-terminal domain-containing protein [Candidatus Gastranaerophilaceae bacterium]|jgi:type IV pilus assembly protein PilQ
MKISYRRFPIFLGSYFLAILLILPAIAAQPVKTRIDLNNTKTGQTKPELRKTSIENQDDIKLQGNVSITSDSKLISLSLRDTDIRQVLRMLADKAGLNIIIHDSVGTAGKKVTLDLVNVTVNKAFEYVMTVNNLVYWMDNDTLIIATKDDSSKLGLNNQKIKTINVKYEDAGRIANFLNKNIFSLNQPNITTGQIAFTNPSKNQIIVTGTQNDINLAEKIVKQLDKEQSSTMFNVNHMTPGQMAGLICKNVFDTGSLPDDVTPSGIGGGKMACSEKDVTNSTVSGGSGLSGSFDSYKSEGFTVMYYSDNGKVLIKGGTSEQLKIAKNFIKENDIKQPQVYLELSIIQLSETGSKELSSTWAYYNAKLALDGGYSSIVSGAKWDGSSGTPATQTGLTYYALDPTNTETGWAKFTDGYLPGGTALKGSTNPIGFVNNLTKTTTYPTSILNALKFLISQSKGRVLANPRLIAKNNVTSTIDITDDYVTKIDTTVTTATTGTVATTNYTTSPLGIKISFKPTITPDGYVYLDLKPDYSVVGTTVTTSTGAFVLKSQRSIDLKGVRVKDGETLVIGGLIQEQESKSIKKLPVLGDLPIIGGAFRSTSNTRSKNELVITVTPRIVTDSADEKNI